MDESPLSRLEEKTEVKRRMAGENQKSIWAGGYRSRIYVNKR